MSETSAPSELVALGEDTLDRLGALIAIGASPLHCQLLACELYDRLALERRRASSTNRARAAALAAALHRCRQARFDPNRMVAELRLALAALQDDPPRGEPPPRPFLRVIQGGLAG